MSDRGRFRDVDAAFGGIGVALAHLCGVDRLTKDAEKMDRVRFKDGTRGAEMFGTGEYFITCGAITTAERYATFGDSLCHLFESGEIKCYGDLVGTKDDLEFLAAVESK